ncbi:MAG: hypothetical protein WBA54_01555 [Acidaminobacteraceae bacterium]
MAFLGLLFLGGFLSGILLSFNMKSIFDIGSLASYKSIVASDDFWMGLKLSLKIAGVSTVISGVMAIILIFVLYYILSCFGLKYMSTIKKVIQIPMLIPYIIAGLFIMILFQRSGIISSLMYKIGFIETISDFPVLINDEFAWGIILTYVWKTTPFIILMVFPKILKVEETWIEVGMMLGVNRLYFFRKVVFQLIKFEWITTCFIVFAFTFSEFEIPYMLGVTYPKTLSVLSYNLFINGDLSERPIALGINLIVAIITLAIGLIGLRLTKHKRNLYE